MWGIKRTPAGVEVFDATIVHHRAQIKQHVARKKLSVTHKQSNFIEKKFGHNGISKESEIRDCWWLQRYRVGNQMYQHYPSVLRGHGTEANSGHPGAPMMAYLLWAEFINYSPYHPDWRNIDQFILANGHACAFQYCILHRIWNLPQWLSKLSSVTA